MIGDLHSCPTPTPTHTQELLYNVQEAPAAGVHPRHICMELDEATQNILAAGWGARGSGAAARSARITVAVVERLRRRMRSKGFRANYTLQQVPRARGGGGASEAEFLSVLHITPVRASRPLALRFLAHKVGLDLGSVAVVALVPEHDPGRQLAACWVTDGPDLVAGSPQVVVVPTPPGASPAPPTRVLLESQPVALEPFMYPGGTRVRVADPENFAQQAVAAALESSKAGHEPPAPA